MTRLVLATVFSLLCLTPAWALQVVTGTHAGTGADNLDIVISPACTPKAVFHHSAGNQAESMVFRTDTMSGDASHLLDASVGLQTNRIQAINSDGYEVGSNTATNAAATNYHYAVFCDNGNSDIATGSYAGDNADGRVIVISPAFSPEFVLVVPAGTTVNTFRGASANSGDQSCPFNSPGACLANHIQAFNADGFEVGGSHNISGTTYHYLAIKGSAGVTSGTFTGNTSDSRDITVAFEPQFLILKGDSASEEGTIRMASNSGDESFCDTAATGFTNIIQAFGATTFQVGTDACANENTVTMRWAAFRTVNPAIPGRRRAF